MQKQKQKKTNRERLNKPQYHNQSYVSAQTLCKMSFVACFGQPQPAKRENRVAPMVTLRQGMPNSMSAPVRL